MKTPGPQNPGDLKDDVENAERSFLPLLRGFLLGGRLLRGLLLGSHLGLTSFSSY
jgi:hypothetical protein